MTIATLRLTLWASCTAVLMANTPSLAAPPGTPDNRTWADRAREVATRRLAAASTHPGSPSHPSGPADETPKRPHAFEIPLMHLAGAADATTSANPSQPVSAAASQPAESTSLRTAIERGPRPHLGSTLKRDLMELPELLWHDTKKVYGDPGNLIFLLAAGGASGALRPEVDDDIDDHYERHHTFRGEWPDTFGAMGNPITHFALAGAWYLAGQQFQDIKTYEVGKRAVSALTITGVSTVLLKLAANTESPNGEEWAWPSGHVSSTMALATVLNDAYGPLVGVPMFGITGLVAVERIDDREHSFSDVVFGAALGWVVAETVMKEHRPEIFGGEIVPYADPVNRTAGVAWVKALGQ
ncbi:MAG TPA: hypothetical protein PKY77_01935 [Phycisphaerae bacterium]|nr:hypothetical protein [Phycisphaerae bacterium]HRY67953.1 hypothetical protein [Phycisphaerae bacterium]HSA26690.1 hypothetical protein [Phycisphaerae bacterium]